MDKLDWSKARSLGRTSPANDISDKAAAEDRLVYDELKKKREKRERKRLNKLPSNWLTTPEQVAAYKRALEEKKDG